jgi:Zn-dependent protease
MIGSELVYSFLLISPLLLISLVLHELAHGWVAWKLGDPTAKLHGRLTLNPLKHLDPWGAVMLAVTFFGSGGRFFFGWAKPVPISPWQFKDPQRGMMLVGLAGPVVNYTLALVSAGLIWLSHTWSPIVVTRALFMLFALNVILGTLNLIPIPPLDGSRVVGGFLPREAYKRWITYDRYGNYVFLGLFVVLVAFPVVFDATFGAVLRLSFRLLPGG